MSKRKVTDQNDFVAVVATAARAQDELVTEGGFYGIVEAPTSSGAVANGADFTLVIRGRFRVPKDANAINQGAKVYYDSANKRVAAADGGPGWKIIGRAVKAALAAATEVEIDLMPELN
jgi:predicted RecA/RadA family phage recombinase